MGFIVEVLRGTDDTPLGELGLGAAFLGRFVAGGGAVEGWEWVYGGAARIPFPPHVALDGTKRRDLTGWTHSGGWPYFEFYFPSDHRGCVCQTVPTLIEPETPPPSTRTVPLPALLDLVRDFLTEHPDRKLSDELGISA